ncbi:uncharacterized protein LOC124290922 isoform X2 [Haliotis rubra]|uniref:uncharacterized protein LOC124290922 isoform X2 n=1 Tax=Haliotis rubra TaxID=36100 RepID=UPI001EE5BEBE|nr:uncharacterized protein LOC124290922 isoform X2 [Haliotis rubra]
MKWTSQHLLVSICLAALGVVPAHSICTVPDQNVRLYNDGGPGGIGILEVKDAATMSWGSVCTDNFDVAAARVVCRMLCFNETYATPMMLQHRTLRQRFRVMYRPFCHGGESNLTECQHSSWGDVDGCTDAVYMTCLEDNPCHPEHCVSEPDAPNISCNNTYMRVDFSKVNDKDLTPAHISLMAPGCPINTYNYDPGSGDVVVSAVIALNTCGVKTSGNETHLFYDTKLIHSPVSDSDGITRRGAYVVDAMCAFEREHEVNIGAEIVTQTIVIVGTGKFRFKMYLWKSDHFFERYSSAVRLHVNDCLNVTVDLITDNDDLKVVVPDCWVVPEPNTPPTHSVDLIRNRTAEENTLVGYRLSRTRFGFKYRVFQFGVINKIRIHCKAVACDLGESSPTCLNRFNYRRKRDTTDDTLSTTVVINPVDTVDNYPVHHGVPAGRKKSKRPSEEKTSLHRSQKEAPPALPVSDLTPTAAPTIAAGTRDEHTPPPTKPVMHLALWKTAALTSDLGPRPDLYRNQTVHMTMETDPNTSELNQSIHITTCRIHPWNDDKPFVELLRNGIPSEDTLTVRRHRGRIVLEFKAPLQMHFTLFVISCKVHACFTDRPMLCSEDTEVTTTVISVVDYPLPKSTAQTQVAGKHARIFTTLAAQADISEKHATRFFPKIPAPKETEEEDEASILPSSEELEDPEPMPPAYWAGNPPIDSGMGILPSGTLLVHTSVLLVYGLFM